MEQVTMFCAAMFVLAASIYALKYFIFDKLEKK